MSDDTLFKEARWLIDEFRARGEDMTADTIAGLLERAEKFLPDWANYQQGRADGVAATRAAAQPGALTDETLRTIALQIMGTKKFEGNIVSAMNILRNALLAHNAGGSDAP